MKKQIKKGEKNMAVPYLGNSKNTIEVLQKYDFVFQKKFGQNFLIDSHVLDKIVSAAGITKDDFVLEIGPGIGTMTQYLAASARKVFAVEIDKALIPILEDTLKEFDNVQVKNWQRSTMTENRLKLWQICHIILQRRLSWDYLKARFRLIQLP